MTRGHKRMHCRVATLLIIRTRQFYSYFFLPATSRARGYLYTQMGWGIYENYGVSERHLAYNGDEMAIFLEGLLNRDSLSIYAIIVQGDFISLCAHAFFLSNNIG